MKKILKLVLLLAGLFTVFLLQKKVIDIQVNNFNKSTKTNKIETLKGYKLDIVNFKDATISDSKDHYVLNVSHPVFANGKAESIKVYMSKYGLTSTYKIKVPFLDKEVLLPMNSKLEMQKYISNNGVKLNTLNCETTYNPTNTKIKFYYNNLVQTKKNYEIVSGQGVYNISKNKFEDNEVKIFAKDSKYGDLNLKGNFSYDNESIIIKNFTCKEISSKKSIGNIIYTPSSNDLLVEVSNLKILSLSEYFDLNYFDKVFISNFSESKISKGTIKFTLENNTINYQSLNVLLENIKLSNDKSQILLEKVMWEHDVNHTEHDVEVLGVLFIDNSFCEKSNSGNILSGKFKISLDEKNSFNLDFKDLNLQTCGIAHNLSGKAIVNKYEFQVDLVSNFYHENHRKLISDLNIPNKKELTYLLPKDTALKGKSELKGNLFLPYSMKHEWMISLENTVLVISPDFNILHDMDIEVSSKKTSFDTAPDIDNAVKQYLLEINVKKGKYKDIEIRTGKITTNDLKIFNFDLFISSKQNQFETTVVPNHVFNIPHVLEGNLVGETYEDRYKISFNGSFKDTFVYEDLEKSKNYLKNTEGKITADISNNNTLVKMEGKGKFAIDINGDDTNYKHNFILDYSSFKQSYNLSVDVDANLEKDNTSIPKSSKQFKIKAKISNYVSKILTTLADGETLEAVKTKTFIRTHNTHNVDIINYEHLDYNYLNNFTEEEFKYSNKYTVSRASFDDLYINWKIINLFSIPNSNEKTYALDIKGLRINDFEIIDLNLESDKANDNIIRLNSSNDEKGSIVIYPKEKAASFVFDIINAKYVKSKHRMNMMYDYAFDLNARFINIDNSVINDFYFAFNPLKDKKFQSLNEGRTFAVEKNNKHIHFSGYAKNMSYLIDKMTILPLIKPDAFEFEGSVDFGSNSNFVNPVMDLKLEGVSIQVNLLGMLPKTNADFSIKSIVPGYNYIKYISNAKILSNIADRFYLELNYENGFVRLDKLEVFGKEKVIRFAGLYDTKLNILDIEIVMLNHKQKFDDFILSKKEIFSFGKHNSYLDYILSKDIKDKINKIKVLGKVENLSILLPK